MPTLIFVIIPILVIFKIQNPACNMTESAKSIFTGGHSPRKTVEAFLDAAISHSDRTLFLAPGADASIVMNHEATSYEIKNIAGDVVSTIIHFQGYEHRNYAPGERIPWIIRSPNSREGIIDMPEAVRFRVHGGKITEVF